jgi:hypothetical protein
MEKQFKVTWGSGYANPGSSVVGLDIINDDNGWDDWAIEKIEDLQIGQVADCSDHGGDVLVERVA